MSWCGILNRVTVREGGPMNQLVRGLVRSGGVVLDAPLDAPDGTAVVVSVGWEGTSADRMSSDEFRALPFFGLQGDAADRRDGVEVVNEERAKWQQRSLRRD
jgi:hypothetical protein